ncbi:hypothetical protein RCL1_004690 [Eukaryota sp. TZLM3-RCL]
MNVSTLFQQLCRGTKLTEPPKPEANKSDDAFALDPSIDSTLSRKRRSTDIQTKSKKKKLAPLPEEDSSLDNESVALVRSSLHISVSNEVDAPAPLLDFQDLSKHSVHSSLISLLSEKFSHPTPIQRQVIPCLFQQRDVLGLAPTGSGKTLSYLIPLITMISSNDSGKSLSGLVLVPTSELANQVNNELKQFLPSNLSSLVLSKKVAKSVTSNSNISANILVSTPLYLIQVLESNTTFLSNLKLFIIDEADKLLETRFLAQFDALLAGIPISCRRCMFSATLHEKLSTFVQNVLIYDPIHVTVGSRNASNSRVAQAVKYCGNIQGKFLAIKDILEGRPLFTDTNNPVLNNFIENKPPILIFVETKEKARFVYKEILLMGITECVEVLHADRSKVAREQALNRFRTGSSWILISTDLAARGLDLKSVNLVVNFDVPGPIDYVHRIGRVGRGIYHGKALTLIEESDGGAIKHLKNIILDSGGYVPSWVSVQQ